MDRTTLRRPPRRGAPWHGRLALAASALALGFGNLGGCPGGECHLTIDTWKIATERIEAGYTFGDREGTYSSESGAVGPYTCDVEFYPRASADVDAPGQGRVEGYVQFFCGLHPHVGGFDEEFVFMFDTDDPRFWEVGTVSAPVRNLMLKYGDPCPDPPCDGEWVYCLLEDPALTIDITVEAASGGAADWPDVVDHDFYRTFTIAISTPEVLRGREYDTGDACERTVDATAFAHFTLTAADLTGTPYEVCD